MDPCINPMAHVLHTRKRRLVELNGINHLKGIMIA